MVEEEQTKELRRSMNTYKIILVTLMLIILFCSSLILINNHERSTQQKVIKPTYNTTECIPALAGSTIPTGYTRYNITHYCLEDVTNE